MGASHISAVRAVIGSWLSTVTLLEFDATPAPARFVSSQAGWPRVLFIFGRLNARYTGSHAFGVLVDVGILGGTLFRKRRVNKLGAQVAVHRAGNDRDRNHARGSRSEHGGCRFVACRCQIPWLAQPYTAWVPSC